MTAPIRPDHTDTPEPWEAKARDEADLSAEFDAAALWGVLVALFLVCVLAGALIALWRLI